MAYTLENSYSRTYSEKIGQAGNEKLTFIYDTRLTQGINSINNVVYWEWDINRYVAVDGHANSGARCVN